MSNQSDRDACDEALRWLEKAEQSENYSAWTLAQFATMRQALNLKRCTS